MAGTLRRIVAITIVTLAVATPRPALADPIGDAKAAMARHDDAGAIATLRPLLASAKPGERSAARSLMVKAAEDGAAAHGDDQAAVRQLLDVANLIAPDPRTAGLNAQAKQLLRVVYGTSTKQKAYDRALWAVTTSAAAFPMDPPLAPEGAVESLRVGAAAIALRTASPRQAYEIVQGLYAAQIPAMAIDLGGLERAGITAAYAATFHDLGWYAQAAAIAADMLNRGDLPLAGKAALSALRMKALAARADTCLAFGNRTMAAAALVDFNTVAGPDDAATGTRLKEALDKLDAAPPDPVPSIGPPQPTVDMATTEPAVPTTTTATSTTQPATLPTTAPAKRTAYVPFQDVPDAPGSGRAPAADPTRPAPATQPIVGAGPASLEPLPLPSAVPALGDQLWIDGGSGYTLAGGTVRVGNCKAEHGGTWAKGNVRVQAGFVLEDGTVNPSSGLLKLEGTAERPIVVRHVRFNCDYTAAFEARFTLFQDCTFAKSGGWHWNSGVNTKWTLADCMLVNCKFNNLNGPDMGVDLTRCALAGTPLPPRVWRNRQKMSDDATEGYRGEWSHVVDCDFYDCRIATSAAWMCVGCNFRECRATDPAPFTSKTPLAVRLGVADDDQPFYDAEVAGATASAGAAQVTYGREPKLYPRPKGPSPLWRLAPAVMP